MTTDLRTKLDSERADLTWEHLETSGHLDAIVVVANDLDLADAGVALANNDVANVQAWLASGRLHRPGDVELATWRAAPERTFEMIVVQPFVLVQLKGEAS